MATSENISIAFSRLAVVFGYNLFYSDDDGISINQSAENGKFDFVTYGNGRLVASSNSSSHGLWYSDDGVNWTQSARTSGYFVLAYGNGRFVAGSRYNTGLWYSDDGVNWTRSAKTSGYFESVAYGNGRFVAGSGDNTGLWYSDDGVNWENGNKTDGDFISIAFGAGQFVACKKAVYGDAGSSGFWNSSDGINWYRNYQIQNGNYIIAYGNGRFVAVDNKTPTVTVRSIIYSDNGLVWNDSSKNDGYFGCVAYDNGRFIAGATIASGNTVEGLWYSDDGGVSWEQGSNRYGRFDSLSFFCYRATVSSSVDRESESRSAGVAHVAEESRGRHSAIVFFGANPNTGYRFFEWRLPDGTPAPDSTINGVTYTCKDSFYKKEINSDFSLVACFSTLVRVTPSFDESSAGGYSIACTFDGQTETFNDTDAIVPLVNLAETTIKLTARTNAITSIFVGWFDPSDTSFEHPISTDAEYTLPNALTSNLEFVARFALKPIDVSVGVESYSSAVNAGQVTASVAGRASVADAHYGDKLTISASANSGYLVGRWEDADGNPLPNSIVDNVIYHATDATYKMVLTEDVSIYHRFRGTVTLTPTHSASAHDGTLSVDGKTNVEPVYFGHDFTIRAVPASGETFKEWYATDDVGLDNPLRYGSEFTTAFSGNFELNGHFVANVAADYSYIALCNLDASGLPLPSAGTLVPSALVESTSDEFLAHSGFSSVPTGAVAYYKCLAITDTRLVATAASGMGVLKWSRELVGKTEADVGGVAYYKDDYIFKSAVYRVYWEDKSPQNVRVGYGGSLDYTSGSLSLDGLDVANPSINDRHVQFGVITDIYSKDDFVRLGFTVNSGYKFTGWYLDAELTVPIPDIEYRDSAYTSESNPSVLKIPSGTNNRVNVYAKIEQDRNAIYEWEGSDVNKSIRWKSKVMAASRPISPSVVRVDATSYPLLLDVGMFSSPNESRVRGCEVAISGQKARRVPAHIRPERFIQVTVKADHEVDAVIVGTSMEGMSV